jgi:radical SAM superfamily enzyme YgiQ (UPF0313 family)
MKLLWIYSSYENLGVETLTAELRRQGHAVDLVLDPRLFDDHFTSVPPLAPLFSFRKRVLREAARRAPDAVLFSVVSDDFPWFRDMARAIKEQQQTLVIAGGIHITSAPVESLEESVADYGIVGEGDEALPDLLARIEKGAPVEDMPNLVWRDSAGVVRANPVRPPVADLDTLPFPDKTIFAHTSYDPRDAYTITCSRGCPFRCTFCNNDLVKEIYGGAHLRLRSVDNAMQELEQAAAQYSPRMINFLDETFGYDKKWLAEFSAQYAQRIGLPCIACTNPNIVTREYAGLLAAMQCRKVDMGVQTVNQDLKRRILNRRETPEQTRAAIAHLQSAGICVAAENIINLPGETEAHLEEMARFYNATRPDILKVFWLRYYPGTKILDMGREAGALNHTDAQDILRGRASGSLASGGSKPSRTARRFHAFFIFMRFMPPGAVEWILNHRLYRLFSVGPLTTVSYALLRLVGRSRGYEAEIMLYRHKKHVRHYLRKWAAGKL